MDLDISRPQVMGILNVTPDSFSDGGRFTAHDAALRHVEAMLEEGASIIDIGGESTRPGAAEVTVDEELARVVPLVEAIRCRFEVPISVDTSKPQVMRESVAAGASMLNDVCALQNEGALEVAALLNVPVCLMHMQGAPRTMQHNPVYGDVVDDVYDFLAQRVDACISAGIKKEHLIVDPGFGFGKTLTHNLRLLHHLDRFKEMGLPLLVGVSRKTMIGAMLDKPVDERLFGSIAAATLAVWQGATIIRAHDVAATLDAVRVAVAVLNDGQTQDKC